MKEKRLSRRDFLRISTVGGVGALLAACAPATAPAAPQAAGTAAPAQPTTAPELTQAPAASAPVTVTFMVPGGQQEDSDFKPVFDEFKARYPEIDGQYTPAGTGYTPQYNDKVLTMIAGGIAPDVFKTQFGAFGAWAAADVYLPLDDLIASNPDITQMDDFFTPHVEGCKVKGKMMALPNDGAPEAIWYNVDMFRAANQALPDDTWTWDTMLSACQALTKQEGDITTQYGVGRPYWLETIWSNGGEIISADGTKCTLDQPEAIEALAWMQDLIQKYKVSPTPQSASEQGDTDRFTTGKLGMIYGVRGSLGTFRSIDQFAFDAAPMVMSNKKNRVTRLLIGWTSIWRQSKHPNEAV